MLMRRFSCSGEWSCRWAGVGMTGQITAPKLLNNSRHCARNRARAAIGQRPVAMAQHRAAQAAPDR
jgi:hypothetical protein